jgi:hypothetical protein
MNVTIGETVLLARMFHEPTTGAAVDPTDPALKYTVDGGANWTTATEPSKQNTQTGYFGTALDTTGLAAGHVSWYLYGTVGGVVQGTAGEFELRANSVDTVSASIASPVFYYPTAATRTTGDNDGGAYTDMAAEDGAYFATGEVNAGTFLDVTVVFATGDTTNKPVAVYAPGRYTGNAPHYIDVYRWDYTAGVDTWETIPAYKMYPRTTDYGYRCGLYPRNISATGEGKLRYVHAGSATGNPAHVLDLDMVQLEFSAVDTETSTALAQLLSLLVDVDEEVDNIETIVETLPDAAAVQTACTASLTAFDVTTGTTANQIVADLIEHGGDGPWTGVDTSSIAADAALAARAARANVNRGVLGCERWDVTYTTITLNGADGSNIPANYGSVILRAWQPLATDSETGHAFKLANFGNGSNLTIDPDGEWASWDAGGANEGRVPIRSALMLSFKVVAGQLIPEGLSFTIAGFNTMNGRAFSYTIPIPQIDPRDDGAEADGDWLFDSKGDSTGMHGLVYSYGGGAVEVVPVATAAEVQTECEEALAAYGAATVADVPTANDNASALLDTVAESNGTTEWTVKGILRAFFALAAGKRAGGSKLAGTRTFTVPGTDKIRISLPTDANGNSTGETVIDVSDV